MSEKVCWCWWCRLSQTKGQVLFEHYAAGLGRGENMGPTWLQLLLNFMERSATVRLGWSAKRFSNSEVVLQGHSLFASIHRTLGVRSLPHKPWHGTGYAQNHYRVSSLCMQVSKSVWTKRLERLLSVIVNLPVDAVMSLQQRMKEI